MLVSDFDYHLPEDLIAQHPPATRGTSRMLLLNRQTGVFADHLFAELPQLLQSGDLLVLNDSRVLPARLFATRAGLHTQSNSPTPTGQIEVLLTEPPPNPEGQGDLAGHNDWLALVRPAKKVQPGETLHFHAPNLSTPVLTATVLSTGDYGERTLRFAPTPNFHAILEHIGHLPLPPYIHRDYTHPDTPEDRERYQTVYSQQSGSAAAPTAGLHFTPEVLSQLERKGVEVSRITLHVGLGTFQPVRVADTHDIHLHAEPYTLSSQTAEALNRAHRENRRIIAVGTTTTRTLEHLARTFESTNGPITAANPLALTPHSGSTSLFLSPDGNNDFKLVRGLLTNFHLPQSTLLMLVSAFAGRKAVLAAYAHAVASRYRFFSYGDCMLIL
jgi:S-adenosylmethionine:tRNA ribosyltransferase-isomerase